MNKRVIRRANDTDYGLAAGVFTQDLAKAHRVIHQLEAGLLGDTWVTLPLKCQLVVTIHYRS